jgi:Zn-dependent peptidase ImmA (M78 family)
VDISLENCTFVHPAPMKNEIFAQRLKSVRKMRGLSMADLESLSGQKIKTSTLSRYEKGEILPSADNLIILSTALQVKPEFFSRPLKIEVNSVEYRKKVVLGKKQLARIEEAVKSRVERYLEVEEILGISKTFDNPVRDMVIKSSDDVEEAAEKILSEWDLGYNPLPNVLNLLEEKSVKVLEVQEDLAFEGLAMTVNGTIPAVVVNTAFKTEKVRFNALHELAHLVLRFEGFSKHQTEKACHRFAAAMLFPRECVWTEFGKTPRSYFHINEFQTINRIYGISCQAALYRSADLGLLPFHQIPHYYQHYFNHNKEEDGLSNYVFQEHSLKLEQLVTRAEATGLISINKAADLLNVPVNEYQKIGTNEESIDELNTSFLSAFNSYYDDEEDDYTDVPLIEPNPDYEGWRYLQSRLDPA